jgi:hypothetical protein
MIAQAMYSQCDIDGNQYLLLDQFVDHRKDDTAIALTEQTVHHDNGRTYQQKTTTGWQICCQWIDGSTTWEKLSDLKESHPIETAEYAVTHDIERIISLVKRCQTRYLKRTHKFSIELPKTVQEALALDKKNGNTLWADAISKEIKNVRVAFKILPDGQPAPIGHQTIPCHMVFDIKIEDF